MRHCAFLLPKEMRVYRTSKWLSSHLRTLLQVYLICLASSCFSPSSRISTIREQYRLRPPRLCLRQILTRVNPSSVLAARQQMQWQAHQPLIKHSKTMAGASPTWPALRLVERASTTLRVHSSLNQRTRKSCSRMTPGMKWSIFSNQKVL